MTNIPLSKDLTIYISSVDLKILEAYATCQGFTLNKAISGILQAWCNDQVASRKT